VFKDPLENFVRAVERAGLRDKVRYLYHGESYSFAPRATSTEAGTLLGAAPIV
jgi:hypothetical protein